MGSIKSPCKEADQISDQPPSVLLIQALPAAGKHDACKWNPVRPSLLKNLQPFGGRVCRKFRMKGERRKRETKASPRNATVNLNSPVLKGTQGSLIWANIFTVSQHSCHSHLTRFSPEPITWSLFSKQVYLLNIYIPDCILYEGTKNRLTNLKTI